jgi:hypothetical protein
MAEEINKFNLPGESREKYGKDSFADAGDEFAAAIDNGVVAVPVAHPGPQGEGEVDEDVFTAAGNSAAKYGR